MKRRRLHKGLPQLAAGAALALVFAGVLALFVAKMRADAVEDATANAGNLASILAEQVQHAMESLDASLRTSVSLLQSKDSEEFISKTARPRLKEFLKQERVELIHAEVMGVTDASGAIIAGSRDGDVRRVNVADREWFSALRDNPAIPMFVSHRIANRVTGKPVVFLSRRLTAQDGTFLGVAFIGVDPKLLLQTSHGVVKAQGVTFSLFDRRGGFLLRQPDAVINAEIGKPIDAKSEWHKVAAAGGGLYHSPGYFDAYPKYVAVRPLPHFPLVVSVGVTDEAVLAKWRERATFVAIAGAVAFAAILGLMFALFSLRERLARSRVRSWLRARRLNLRTAELADTNKRFGITLDYMAHGMAMYDPQQRLVVSNRWYADLYGLRPESLRPGLSLRAVIGLRIANGVYANGSPEAYMNGAESHVRLPERYDTLNDGRIILARTRMLDGGGWVTMQEDVTERIRSTERLAHMALHDGLTDLPNRAAFRNRLEEAARTAPQAGVHHVVLLVDIDGFKMVNDTYGHDVGDAVLKEIAPRLARASGGGYVARLGGDEFVMLAARAACDGDCVAALAEQILRGVSRPMNIGGRPIALTVCTGAVALDGGETFDPARVMRRADLALAEAKAAGSDRYRVFDVEMERRFDQRGALAGELREAIARDQLELHYQPIVTAFNRKTVCLEALVRWRHPTRGMISPGVFIPLAEETGLIIQLGDWVMRRACFDAARWPEKIAVAVNVSSLQLSQPRFADSVSQSLAAAGLAPARLQIEITESVLLQDDKHTIAELHALHALGVSFALDDFGTGFASLAYLKKVPLAKVKIDKSFVDDVCTDAQSVAIVGAVVALARGLGIVTTAEGVETQEQWDALRALGVATMQGYFFGRPRPIAEQDLSAERAA